MVYEGREVNTVERRRLGRQGDRERSVRWNAKGLECESSVGEWERDSV